MFGYLVCGCQAILSPAADIAKILALFIALILSRLLSEVGWKPTLRS
jgi:hypothetical protein